MLREEPNIIIKRLSLRSAACHRNIPPARKKIALQVPSKNDDQIDWMVNSNSNSVLFDNYWDIFSIHYAICLPLRLAHLYGWSLRALTSDLYFHWKPVWRSWFCKNADGRSLLFSYITTNWRLLITTAPLFCAVQTFNHSTRTTGEIIVFFMRNRY